jgi:hypothetical protein
VSGGEDEGDDRARERLQERITHAPSVQATPRLAVRRRGCPGPDERLRCLEDPIDAASELGSAPDAVGRAEEDVIVEDLRLRRGGFEEEAPER